MIIHLIEATNDKIKSMSVVFTLCPMKKNSLCCTVKTSTRDLTQYSQPPEVDMDEVYKCLADHSIIFNY